LPYPLADAYRYEIRRLHDVAAAFRHRSSRHVEPDINPFSVLSLIVAPAILTNAVSVLVMSTSNRLARAVDRARELSKQLEGEDMHSAVTERRLRELSASETRAMLLLQSLRLYYAALGGFASATLLSLLGAVVVSMNVAVAVAPLLEALAVLTGAIAVGALVYGSAMLVRETRIAVLMLQKRAADVRARAAGMTDPGIRYGAP
jgi:hypothetical protein